MGMVAALWLCAAEPGLGAPPPPAPEPLKWGVTLALGPDALATWWPRIETVSGWSELELSYRALRWLRFGAHFGAAYSPPNRPTFPGHHGVFRALAGADVLMAIGAADLFAGVAAGVQHTNLLGDEDSPPHLGYSSPWGTGPALVARVGADFHISATLSMGGALAYEFFFLFADGYQSAELRWRLTILF